MKGSIQRLWHTTRRLSFKITLSLLCLFVALWVYQHRARAINDGTWKRVQEQGIIRVGMDASYPPFGDTPNGVPVGLDVDIANEIARRIGVKAQIVNMGFDGLYDSLKTNGVDMLISALSINPTKYGEVIYSQPYIDAGPVIVSASKPYAQMTDLEGLTIAVEYGSIGDDLARKWQRRLHKLTLVRLTTAQDAITAADNGTVDAALVDNIAARLYRRTHPQLVISPESVAPDTYSIATRGASFDLAKVISRALADMQCDGTLTTIIDRWL